MTGQTRGLGLEKIFDPAGRMNFTKREEMKIGHGNDTGIGVWADCTSAINSPASGHFAGWCYDFEIALKLLRIAGWKAPVVTTRTDRFYSIGSGIMREASFLW